MAEQLRRVRDRVLGNADLHQGDAVLDVGCGDGLIAFGALERVGDHGQVVFSDLSSDLINRCRVTASQLGVLDRCQFVVTSADDLHRITTGSVDVVTTRSVLIYVDRKAHAFAEFARVLRPGGRLSIGEPINRFSYPEPPDRFLGYDVKAIVELTQKLERFFDREERPRIGAMMDFDERDLVTLAERAGFVEIHLDYEASIESPRPEPWERFLHVAGNPLSPTIADAISASLTVEERDRFEAHLRPLVESGQGRERRAFAYLRARR